MQEDFQIKFPFRPESRSHPSERYVKGPRDWCVSGEDRECMEGHAS